MHRKTPVLESLFKKLQTFRSGTLLKRDFIKKVFSCEYCEIFKNTYFEEHLQTTTCAILIELRCKSYDWF